MELFGGLMKGLKPLMDATGVKADESMQLTMLQGDMAELERKKREALAEVGQAAYDMVKADTWNREQLLKLCIEVDNAEAQLNAKRMEVEKAQKAADEKERQEKEKLDARTCPSCSEVNPEGTRFCQSCGAKLGIVKPAAHVCKACGAVNTAESRFCGECGAKMEVPEPTEAVCPECGNVNSAGTKFCSQCGTRL